MKKLLLFLTQLAIGLWLAPLLRAQDPGVEGLFVTVQNPITSEVVNRVKETTNRAVDRWRGGNQNREAAQRRALKIVYDFNPGNHPRRSDDFGVNQNLAEYLLELQDITTIAYVHNQVSGHDVLPVLACKEIVMSAEAKLGDVMGEQARPLRDYQLQFYKSVAEGRSRYPAIVLKMLDKNLVVLEGQRLRDGSVWYLDARQEAEEKSRGIVVGQRREPVLGTDRDSTLFDATQAQNFKLRPNMATMESRQQIAEAYHMPLREDPLMGRPPVAWRVEVRGQMTADVEESLKRRIRKAVGRGANLIVLEINCGGGETIVATDLAKFLRELTDSEGRFPVMTIAWIPSAAPDTATFLALGCTEIVMSNEATIGDFKAILFEEQGGKQVDREVDQLKVKALRALAEEQGYPPLLFQGMLDRKLTIYEAVSQKGQHERRLLTGEELADDKKLPEPRWGKESLIKAGGPDGKPLVLTAKEARELGVARHVVDGWDDLCKSYGLDPKQVASSKSDWLDDLASFLRLPFVSVFLVMIGITCLILELKIPGVGVPGVIAALCFIFFFWAHSQLAGQMTMLAVLLFALGLILIGLEIFVLPGFGVAGVSGIVLVLGSLGLVAYGHWPQSSYEWAAFGKKVGPFGLSLFGAVVAAVILARYLPQMPYVNRLILKPQGEDSDLPGDFSPSPLHPDYSSLLGAMGVAATPLRPAGKAKFGEEFVDVIAEGSYVVPGTRVQVIEIEGNRVVVKEVV
jgi:membrane-bound ClpP family serine protease